MLITSKGNKYIKEYLNLKKNKKARDKKNLFIIEGVRLLFESVVQNANVKNIFVTKDCLQKLKSEKYDITKFKRYNIIDDNISNLMSDTKNSQGIYGIVEKPGTFDIKKISKKENCLALFKVSNPGNVGTLIRSAFCFGIKKIILYNCCDIYNPKVIRSSMGAIFSLKFNFSNNFKETLNILHKNSIRTFATVAKSFSNSPENLNKKKGVLILGAENDGLPNDIICLSSETITIKMSNNAESLNVATAGSILMYELTRKI